MAKVIDKFKTTDGLDACIVPANVFYSTHDFSTRRTEVVGVGGNLFVEDPDNSFKNWLKEAFE
jgi:hypothetical protein